MQNGKELWISLIYFPMENSVDRVARLESIVDRGGVDKRAQRRLAGARARVLTGDGGGGRAG
jgi:hypothetical protein